MDQVDKEFEGDDFFWSDDSDSDEMEEHDLQAKLENKGDQIESDSEDEDDDKSEGSEGEDDDDEFKKGMGKSFSDAFKKIVTKETKGSSVSVLFLSYIL